MKGESRGAAGWRQVLLMLALALSMVSLAPPGLALEPDGASVEQAVPIQAASTSEGIAAENAYIRSRYPGWRKVGQALLRRGGRAYDRITIVSPSGEQKHIYFDITAFFGRM